MPKRYPDRSSLPVRPIIGQEALCPDGLGRVSAYNLERANPHIYIQVETYFHNRSCKWNPDNVELVPFETYVHLSA